MKVLKDILYKVPLQAIAGNTDISIKEIQFDSRLVKAGDLFIAVKGTQSDGHNYIETAIKNGAVAIVGENIETSQIPGITYVSVKDSSFALGVIASNYFDNPSEKLKIVAVTGTNGKTTTVTLLFDLFGQLGYNRGLLSTVENRINDEIIPATHTTPDAIQLNRLLATMVKKSCTHCFMEASSHAIDQNRISGIDIDIAVFTNITHDHLDYHLTFDNYIKAKKGLFDNLKKSAYALVNVDDKHGRVMLQNTKANQKTYGIKNMADFKAKINANTFLGLEMVIDGHDAWFPLVGMFNGYNLLTAYACANLLGEESTEVLATLSLIRKVAGRFELIHPESGIYAIVDYAHTPNALENVLETISGIRTGNEKLITVFGCGGDRDKEKRPLMAAIACKFSDKVIITSDNPRSEDPDQIINEIAAGVPPQHYRKTMKISDRKEAIKIACNMAEKKDMILVAGKGHENYQEIKGKKFDFDDRAILYELLEEIKS